MFAMDIIGTPTQSSVGIEGMAVVHFMSKLTFWDIRRFILMVFLKKKSTILSRPEK